MSSEKTSTREKLLSAAGDLFMEKGYRDATVAEICRRADANISAVNYHFGSKEALYQQAWRHSFAASLAAHPQDGGVGGDAPVEERLAGRLRALVRRIGDPDNRDFFISQMEIINPTGLLEEVMRVELSPQREQTLALVRELLGPGATERQVRFSELSIVSLCLHPMLMRRVRRRTAEGKEPDFMEDPEAYAEHVVAFALAGLARVREKSMTGPEA